MHVQQSAIEQAEAEVRAGHYVEAWTRAGREARARAYVRYHAGDLEGALSEARTDPRDAWLCATSAEIALSLHRGGVAERALEDWRRCAAPEDAPKLASAAQDLGALRATERAAADGIRRARWITAGALALALAFLLRFARLRA